ncbi:MAG: hypothetical protein ACPGWR_01880 [Ardenticatenaceae bacterium]
MALQQEEMVDAPAMAFQTLLMILVGVVVGVTSAVFILPTLLPGLSASLLGAEPKAYWYLSRTSGIVAYILIWLSMSLGVMITNKMARVWPGGPTAFDLHQHTALLGFALSLFHALILMGDRYINYSLFEILLPFTTSYEPLWVGLGQVGFYLLAIVSFSFYVRKQITRRVWRLIHYFSFLLFLFVLAHGVMSGTDSGTLWATLMYWFTGASLLFLTVYRIVVSVAGTPKKRPARKAKAAIKGGNSLNQAIAQ